MDKKSINRREFFLHLWRTPATVAILMILSLFLGYEIWQSRAGIAGAVAQVGFWFFVVFIGELLPMIIGFTCQFFMSKPVPKPALWVFAIALTGVSYITTPIETNTDTPAWVLLVFLVPAFFVQVFFLNVGAAACRRWFSQRFRQHE